MKKIKKILTLGFTSTGRAHLIKKISEKMNVALKAETKLVIKKYYPDMNIFLDKSWTNKKNNDFLKDKFIIQIPRHYKKNIQIQNAGNITLYRALSEKNNNKYNDWETLNMELAIKGFTCEHSKIIKKKFKPGLLILRHGGPVSSDPIFLEELDHQNIKIITNTITKVINLWLYKILKRKFFYEDQS